MKTLARTAGLLLASALGAGSAHAQLACTIATAPPMAFGSYNPLLFTDHNAQTSVNIRCTGSGVRLMRARLGPGLAGTVDARVMRRSGVSLSYGLYLNSGRTIAWGDGTGGTFPNFLFVGPATDATLQMYGRITQRQNVPVGLYTDTVTLQLDW